MINCRLIKVSGVSKMRRRTSHYKLQWLEALRTEAYLITLPVAIQADLRRAGLLFQACQLSSITFKYVGRIRIL